MKTNGWIALSLALLAFTLPARADAQLEAAPKKTAKPVLATPPTSSMEQPLVLTPGAATVVGKNINVRGKAGFVGEVVAKLQDGDAVTILEQVILTKTKAGEPAQWAKIVYPASAHVWVHGAYLNADNTVKPRKLNVRTGAGENYSIVGTIEQGTAVSVVSTKGNWTQIQAPVTAFAYVAASFVRQSAATSEVPPVLTIQTPAPTPTTITSEPNVAAVTTDDPTEPMPTVIEDTTVAAVPPPVVEEVWVPRTVSHEGVVRGTISIQAPTRYGLYSKENGKLINFLHSPTPQLELSKYFNRHIIVSGQEGLEERWKNTPILTIQKIYVVE